jgi:phage FluMu protein Com
MNVLIKGQDRKYKTECSNCKSILQYHDNDTFTIVEKDKLLTGSKADFKYLAVKCPICNEKVKIKFLGISL